MIWLRIISPSVDSNEVIRPHARLICDAYEWRAHNATAIMKYWMEMPSWLPKMESLDGNRMERACGVRNFRKNISTRVKAECGTGSTEPINNFCVPIVLKRRVRRTHCPSVAHTVEKYRFVSVNSFYLSLSFGVNVVARLFVDLDARAFVVYSFCCRCCEFWYCKRGIHL